MQLITNVVELFRTFARALQEPEVKGAYTVVFTLIVIATVFYRYVEEWSFLDSLYFSIVTIATVGYGDLAPKSALGKIFTIGYIFAGIGIFVAAATAFAHAALRREQQQQD